MIKPVQFLRKLQPPKKHSISAQKLSGFTMIELLVGTVIAFIIITPLMGLVLGLLNDDSKESAKGTTEQEIQTALDYISEDVSQAIYIYDKTGVTAINDANGLPQLANKVPILVFWKRKLETEIIPPYKNASCPTECDDTFVYSLVAYYLSTDNPNNTWSSAARIERWEIQDGVKNPFPADPANPDYLKDPDKGFKLFDLKATVDTKSPNALPAIQQQMNQWQKGTDAYAQSPVALMDYVDQSQGPSPSPTAVYCTTTVSSDAQLVNDASSNAKNSFYACVDTGKNLAKVFIRGNALARIEKNATYSSNKSLYFPVSNVQIQGISGLGQ